MNILVVAANGRTGRLVVDQAINSGHSVTALVRNNEATDFKKEVKVIKGDATDKQVVKEVAKNQEVIISTIGHVKGSQANVQSKSIENMIRAIQEHGSNTKIVSLTGNGVRQNEDKLFFLDRLLNWSIKLVDPKRIQDGKDHVELLQDSGVNWVVVRVLKLSNTKVINFKLSKNGPAKLLVSRSEAASALLQVAESSEWDRKLPIISNA